MSLEEFMYVRQNRTLSFIIVALIYLFASAVGIITYYFLPLYEIWLKLLIADVVATVFTFIFSVICKNASVYDPYWSVQPIVILAVATILNGGTNASGILMLVAVSIWGVRLTANWAYTFGDLTHQDWRYTMLKEKTGNAYPIINFVGIHLVPTLVVYACTLPALYVILICPPVNVGNIIFFILSLAAVCLQGAADIQMHTYRQNKTSPFICSGVWKYSRHPNYLAEILMWWTVGLAMVCVIPNFWYLLAGALLNTLLFAFVSIPMADGRQSRKEGFAEYKSKTRAVLPIPKKVK